MKLLTFYNVLLIAVTAFLILFLIRNIIIAVDTIQNVKLIKRQEEAYKTEYFRYTMYLHDLMELDCPSEHLNVKGIYTEPFTNNKELRWSFICFGNAIRDLNEVYGKPNDQMVEEMLAEIRQIACSKNERFFTMMQ